MNKLRAITVRFSAEEKQKTEQNAAVTGLSVSRFLAKTGSAATQPLTKEEKNFLIEIILQLRRIGNNLNQLAIAQNASRFGNTAAPASSEIERAGIELKKLIQILRNKL